MRKREAPDLMMVCSDFFLEVFSCDFAIPENLSKKSATDSLATMNWNHGASAIGMTQKVVASLDSDEIKPEPSKCFDKLDTVDRRKCAHAMTAIRWTPIN